MNADGADLRGPGSGMIGNHRRCVSALLPSPGFREADPRGEQGQKHHRPGRGGTQDPIRGEQDHSPAKFLMEQGIQRYDILSGRSFWRNSVRVQKSMDYVASKGDHAARGG